MSTLRRVVIVGGSIAAVTTAQSLRAQNFDGEILLLSEERHAPYSRVPLSKGALSGKQTLDSAALPALSEDVTVRLGARGASLRPQKRLVALADGEEVPYDGLVVATGARARRLAGSGQRGEHVVRTLGDATALRERIGTAARSAVVIGGGYLGMEVASTCVELGWDVTVVDRDPPLRRLLGTWLADLVVEAAREWGVRFVRAPDGVELLGGSEITGVDCGDRRLDADIVISAVGDVPNTEWLAGSGLPLDGALVVDQRCRAAPDIVAAGDVTATRVNGERPQRHPHWTSAVLQGRAAASALLHGDAAPLPRSDPYYWTEQFGLDIKISGEIPADGQPSVLAGDPGKRSVLLQWHDADRPAAAASINHRIPIVKLKKLGARAAPD